MVDSNTFVTPTEDMDAGVQIPLWSIVTLKRLIIDIGMR